MARMIVIGAIGMTRAPTDRLWLIRVDEARGEGMTLTEQQEAELAAVLLRFYQERF